MPAKVRPDSTRAPSPPMRPRHYLDGDHRLGVLNGRFCVHVEVGERTGAKRACRRLGEPPAGRARTARCRSEAVRLPGASWFLRGGAMISPWCTKRRERIGASDVSGEELESYGKMLFTAGVWACGIRASSEP